MEGVFNIRISTSARTVEAVLEAAPAVGADRDAAVVRRSGGGLEEVLPHTSHRCRVIIKSDQEIARQVATC